MSNEAITAVLRHSQSTLGARLVMLIIANVADHDGVAHPHIPYVCEATKLSRAAVHDQFSKLEIMGELAIHRGRGRGNLSLYAICLPGLKGPDSGRFSNAEKVQILDKKGPDSGQEKVQILDKKTPTPLKDTIVNTIGHQSYVNVAREQTGEEWAIRGELFDAYCAGVGIAKSSPEYMRRFNFASSDLPAATLTALTPTKLESMARYTLANWAAAGISKTPTLARVLETEAEFDRTQSNGAAGALSASDLLTLANQLEEGSTHERTGNLSLTRHAENRISARNR